MAEDLIELGIEGIDKLVDKHFHKVPDKYIDPHTYHPRRWRRHGDGEESEENENLPRVDYDASKDYEYIVPPSTSGIGIQDNRRRKRRDNLVRRSSSQPGVPRDNDREKTIGDREQDRRRRKSLSDERRRDIEGVGRENGNGGGQNKTEKVVLTLLGAAVGGLAVRAVIDRLDRKSGKGDDMRSGERTRTGGEGRGGGDEKQVIKGRGRR